jgi:hypothetical protein
MSTSRFVKIMFGDGRIRAINMANVISVTRQTSAITIQYNVSYGIRKSYIPSGGVYTMPYHETINYNNDEDAEKILVTLCG